MEVVLGSVCTRILSERLGSYEPPHGMMLESKRWTASMVTELIVFISDPAKSCDSLPCGSETGVTGFEPAL